MKKFFITAFIALTAMAANAESWIAGSVGIDITTPKGGDTETTISVAPEYGYSFNDKWAIGVALVDKVTFEADYDVNTVSIEPFARYTFAKTGIASFFVDGGVGFGCEYALDNEGEMLDDTAWNLSIGFKPGIKLDITENLSLVAKLGFFGYKHDANPDDAVNYFGLKVDGDALSFGMHWNF